MLRPSPGAPTDLAEGCRGEGWGTGRLFPGPRLGHLGLWIELLDPLGGRLSSTSVYSKPPRQLYWESGVTAPTHPHLWLPHGPHHVSPLSSQTLLLVPQHITCSPAQGFTLAAASIWGAFPMLPTGSLTAYSFCLAVTPSKRTSLSVQVKYHTLQPPYFLYSIYHSWPMIHLLVNLLSISYLMHAPWGQDLCLLQYLQSLTKTLAPEHVAQ